VKIPDGGYVPLLLASVIFLLILTWRRGRVLLRQAVERRSTALNDVIANLTMYETVPGTAIYMTGYPDTAPPALLTNLKYNRVRHEVIVLLTVKTEATPRVPAEKRHNVDRKANNVFIVDLHYGFMETMNLMDHMLDVIIDRDLPIDITDAIFVLGNETITLRDGKGMQRWRKALFRFVHRNSRTPVDYFGIPEKRALEVGSHVQL
jgi:KUP system potassium uptake protein